MARTRSFGSTQIESIWPVRAAERAGQRRTFFTDAPPTVEWLCNMFFWVRRINVVLGLRIAEGAVPGAPLDEDIGLTITRLGPPDGEERRLASPGVADDAAVPILDPYLLHTAWEGTTGDITTHPLIDGYNLTLRLLLLHSGYETPETLPGTVPAGHVHPSVRLELSLTYDVGTELAAFGSTATFTDGFEEVGSGSESLTDQTIAADVDGLPLAVRIKDPGGLMFRTPALGAPTLSLRLGTVGVPIVGGYYERRGTPLVGPASGPIRDADTGAWLLPTQDELLMPI